MKYELLNDISGVAVLVIITFVFSILFEPRYSKKTYLFSLIPFMTVLFAINIFAIFKLGFAEYGKITVLIGTIPSLIYFYITSSFRDGRFLFTFCLIDTSAILFSIITGMVDYFCRAQGLVNFILRIALGPVIVFLVYRYLRKFYLNIMHTIKKGWWIFTNITVVAYALLIMVSSYPVTLRERPEDIPAVILISILLVMMYSNIFYALSAQQKVNDQEAIQHSFAVQSEMIKKRAEEIQGAEEKIRMARHDLRHHIKIIEEFTLNDQKEQLLEYIGTLSDGAEDLGIEHFCSNPVLNAILTSYFRQAKEAGITVETKLDIPDELPVPAMELATVFANALENAIHANSKLPEGKRKIIFNCISFPTLMFEIKNPYKGKVALDMNGLPVATAKGHGIGSKSVCAFCQKHGASYLYETQNGWFRLMVSL